MSIAVTSLIAFTLAVPSGTLVEYVSHRWVLHAPRRAFAAHRHRMHHKANAADNRPAGSAEGGTCSW